ncbi:hypothetical protein NUU61_009456 [Penicillium alfredii]|uniref:ATPase inhibitor, mitochondrial n=1 Tax=Penicillium alfredii TaxID=1506179 RepID=A0A9W9EN55_9EURO|nr:uncharacterized protein NUU61_009456 [Penicillium alfredii]KAJ5084877.1 hypothetical protein NUU61_009456 [Penicillium alfredii]
MQSLSRPILRAAASPKLLRPFSAAPSVMGEGDLGSPKTRGFLSEKDQFTRREAAQEAMYIRQQEIEKYALLCDLALSLESFSVYLWMFVLFKPWLTPSGRLNRLREKLKEQRRHMDELDKHIEEFTKSQGGEQN